MDRPAVERAFTVLRRTFIAGLAAALALVHAPAFAARPLLDYHRLDAYFALYARDTSVPWKPAAVRLDTYTSAPVQFTLYQADVAEVISAGANTRPRSIDTRKRKPLAQWTFTPAGGYRFESSDVAVPLGSREGFFVVEARRGNVGEQVWIERTRVGLISKETPGGIVLYGADLATGKALAGMRVSFIANGRFVDRTSDRSGVVVWESSPRPVFALAQWGASSTFLSFLPQAPLPRTIVGIKTDSAVVHAGDVLHVVGFARKRSGPALRSAGGSAAVALRSNRGTLVQSSVRLDAAGAFSAVLRVPQNSAAGDYVIMATVNGTSAATGLHVDANAGNLTLSATVQCETFCDASADVPVIVRAMRGALPAPGVAVSASIIRSPHVYADETPQAPWGIAQWYAVTVLTGADGRASIAIPHPTDGLPSTYGVRLSAGGATADTRVVVPTSPQTIRLALDRTDIGSGMPASFRVFANDVSGGKPLPGAHVQVRLMHGASVQEQQIVLDENGRGRGAFTEPEAGSNLILASLQGADAMDAAELQVEPVTMQMSGAGNQNAAIVLDRARYVPGEEARVHASLSGASGDALITLESGASAQAHVVAVEDGSASLRLRLSNAPGALAVGGAFVRDGALQWASAPLALDAPGRPLIAALLFDRAAYGPGALVLARLDGLRAGSGTLAVRITKSEPTGSALFSSAPDLLSVGSTATQDTAIDGASWHAWVDSTGDHPAMQSFARRSEPPPDLTMTQADTQSVYWHVERHSGESVQLQAPLTPGKYVVSLLEIGDDGRVIAASGDVTVQ
ncbi:MAG: hypothetical protein ABR508_02140 [Candidatus Baltobacteraceae bacterium]